MGKLEIFGSAWLRELRDLHARRSFRWHVSPIIPASAHPAFAHTVTARANAKIHVLEKVAALYVLYTRIVQRAQVDNFKNEITRYS